MSIGSFISARFESTRALLLVLALAAASLSPATQLVFGVDDTYILANGEAPDWSRRASVFTVDVPSQAGQRLGTWWSGLAYRRHFLRFAPSLLMSAEVALFGHRPLPMHLVSLALHLLNTALLFVLLSQVTRSPGASFPRGLRLCPAPRGDGAGELARRSSHPAAPRPSRSAPASS